MNVNAIRTNLAGVRFGSYRQEAPEGYEWAKDDGCPEGGLYLRRKIDKCQCRDRANECELRAIEKDKEKNPINIDPMSCCPKGHVPYYTYDGRCIYIPTKK